jgi:hypothetical protein
MPLSDRDYMKGKHPPTCTCVDCVNERLGVIKHQKHKDKRKSEKPLAEHLKPPIFTTPAIKTNKRKIPNWLKALLLVISLSGVGLGVSYYVGSFITFWILFGFSIIYSIEKCFSYITRKYKAIGKLYRLLLNLSILSVFGLLIWSGIKLFSHQFVHSSLAGGLLFLAELVFFIWMWRMVSKNSWRWPSMKLTAFSLIVIFLILAFAGVNPFSNYKDNAISGVSNYFAKIHTSATNENVVVSNPTQSTLANSHINSTTSSVISSATPTVTQTISNDKIDPRTGTYKHYYLGLVDSEGGFLSGSGCYDDKGDFIVLINNKNAINPTYNELVSFLQKDKTDEFPYDYTFPVTGWYYGTAESNVDLARIQQIIDGSFQPYKPNICDDFAERLHNNAELAGIRCAFVSIDLSGYPDPFHYGIPSNTGHALDAFQTVDKGLIYIDDTNTPGPTRSVAIVNVTVGQAYIPKLLFNDIGWLPTSMGTVINVEVIWDGTWND